MILLIIKLNVVSVCMILLITIHLTVADLRQRVVTVSRVGVGLLGDGHMVADLSASGIPVLVGLCIT